ncbi:MAG: HD domain-containing protein, partial [Verrucomicrobia bacterium]|nr:HD domain-containing protein [Verrucomicrobiota bacterium]
MRVAGGWVRDKLLGAESKDIDITLSAMTGGEFLHCLGLEGQIVEANPEKSKHLETAKARILDMEVDFVNLRSETYAESRVPTIQMGTPEEDARRRDLTINALFYNIDTSQVEDHVGGLADLSAMLLRTPTEPMQTFLDDPLRMMRLLRFHARFPGSRIDPEAEAALRDPEALQAFRQKVSRERSGPEFMGMLSGQAPASAVRLFLDSGLYRSVFPVPMMSETLGIRMDQKNRHHSLNLLDHTVEVVRNVNQLMLERGTSKEMRALMNAAALFHDFGKMHPRGRQEHPTRAGEMQYVGHEDVSAEFVEESLRAIGIGSDERQVVNR